MGSMRVGSEGQASQIQNLQETAESPLQAATEQSAPETLQQAANPAQAKAAWSLHTQQADLSMLASQLGEVTTPDDVEYTPDWITPEEFYATAPAFTRTLDQVVGQLQSLLQGAVDDALQEAPTQQAPSTQQAAPTQQAPSTQQAAPNEQAPSTQQVPQTLQEALQLFARELVKQAQLSGKVEQLSGVVDQLAVSWVATQTGADPKDVARSLGRSIRGGGVLGNQISPETRERALKPANYDSLDAARAGNYVRAGSQGPEVKALQEALNKAGIKPPLEANGTFDAKTQAAVRKFQAERGCAVDGIVGPETMGALDVALGLPRRSGPSTSRTGAGSVSAGQSAEQAYRAAPVAPGQANRIGAMQAALGEIGVREATGNNDGVPASRYSRGRNAAWCANFVSWSFRQAGTPLPGNQSSLGSCDYMMGQLKSSGTWFDRGQGTPQPGDVIMFGVPGDATHTGIVTRVENGKVYTIEGNTSDRVAERSYSLNSSRILGYGRP